MRPTDTLGDLLSRIKNASKAGHETVTIPSSKLKMEIVRVLHEEKFVKHYEVSKDNKQGMLKVYLKYGPAKERVISNLRRVSRPGRRVYASAKELKPIRGGLGFTILSTPKGVLTVAQAKKQNVGGEVLCEGW